MFLQELAQNLYARYGEEISSLNILFPSRRARVFFVDALSRIARKPLWQPHWKTVDELMSELSGVRVGDRVRLIAELYKVWSQHHAEPFDKFYFWGELLLADFDTVDKYLVDADMLFRNLADIKELDADTSYFTSSQLKIVSFWANFADGQSLSKEKQRFLKVWQSLGAVYREFRARLQAQGMAYTGMMHRAAVEKSDEELTINHEKFVVAGFNALTECEKRLFRRLPDAEFYWDYDDYYTARPEQEAGRWMRENLRMFPPKAEISHDNFLKPKWIEVISTVSDAVQCKYVATILRELAEKQGSLGKETAIVLTDEGLLTPLLYALPPEIGKVNVTMGYPLKQTLAYSFVERLIELQHHTRVSKAGDPQFYHADVSGLLSHPYVGAIDPVRTAELQGSILRDRRMMIDARWLGENSPSLARIFRPATDWRDLSRYLLDGIALVGETSDVDRTELLTLLSEEISKLSNTLNDCEIELVTATFTSLLRRHLQTLRIPYEGEPLEGVQVMGVLETRNLDFRHVILLSCTDDNFPGRTTAAASFIPYNLRSAYGLPTPEYHEGTAAYHFYRLVQRAETVSMLYCAHADEKTTGEQSRYIYQLAYETPFEIHRREVGIDVNRAETAPIEVPKTGDVAEKLMRYVNNSAFGIQHSALPLSPTSFFRYVACPLRFYFHSVAGLRPDEELSEEVDAPMFGTILHAAMQRLYQPLVGEKNPGDLLRKITPAEIEQAVTHSINENYLRSPGASPEDYSGNLLLVGEIVSKYIGHVIRHDAAHDRFTVEGLEQKVETEFAFPAPRSCEGGKPETLWKVLFAGTADRLDRFADGTLRVVDYKTGEPHLEFAGLDNLFHGDGKQRQSNILQTLLYAMMSGNDAVPTLYYVRAMNRPDYDPHLTDKQTNKTGARYAEYAPEFEQLLRDTLQELFDPEIPFRQTDDPEHTCRYCDFKEICRR